MHIAVLAVMEPIKKNTELLARDANPALDFSFNQPAHPLHTPSISSASASSHTH
jgi:hypothetical protein